jgi:acyl carrier protein
MPTSLRLLGAKSIRKTMTVCEVIERETGQAVNESTPLESLNVDSLEFIELLLVIGNETGKDITNIADLKTVADIVKAVA